MNTAGGTAIRMLDACTDESCEYVQGEQPFNQNEGDTGGWLQMTGRRWYPTSETLEDGSIIVIGGDKNGGYVNTAAQDNPTYEFFPPKGDGQAVEFAFLSETLPINLYALTWMMPSGKLFIQSNRRSILFDYKTKDQEELPEMPYAARVYPASAATMMLPLLPENNYTATILFCGGSNPPQWGTDGTAGYNVTAVPADNTCVRISPDSANPTYDDDDYMLEGRSMGQFVLMPDGTAWMGNGVAMGTAGYGTELDYPHRRTNECTILPLSYYPTHRFLSLDPTPMPTLLPPNGDPGQMSKGGTHHTTMKFDLPTLAHPLHYLTEVNHSI
jgi:hypothetical protein